MRKKVIKNISKNVPKNYNLTLRACARERRETLSGKPSRRVKKKKTGNRLNKNVKRKETKCVFECALQTGIERINVKKQTKKNYLSTNTAKLTSVDHLHKEEVIASISSENSFNPK